jgi:hypothetical protein
MSVERSGFRARVVTGCLLLGLSVSAARAASAPPPLALAAGARVGVVSLLDAEVTHYHSAPRVQDSFLKTQAVPWSVSAMLLEAVREPLTRLGLTPVPLAAGETLTAIASPASSMPTRRRRRLGTVPRPTRASPPRKVSRRSSCPGLG